MEPPVAVGKVLAPWGVRGDVKIAPFSRSLDRFTPGTQVYLGETALVVERSRSHKGHFVVKFASVSDLGTAEEMRGTELTIPVSELPPPPQGVFYQFQLIGLAAVTPSGEPLGTIARVLETGANDVYLIERPDGGETLIPAVRDVVIEIDLNGGRMVVDPPVGL